MNIFLLWQKASLSSSCPWLLFSGSTMDFWGKNLAYSVRTVPLQRM